MPAREWGANAIYGNGSVYYDYTSIAACTDCDIFVLAAVLR